MVQRRFQFRINIYFLTAASAFLGSCILLNYIFAGLELSWFIRIILSAAACFILAFALKLIRPGNIYRIVKYGEV
jgi:hypothetical protein